MAKPIISGVEHLWAYIASDEKGAEFFKSCNIAKGKSAESGDKNAGIKYFLYDADGGLDRLYGGYFNDWINGGQWNRTNQFLSKLLKVVRKSRMEIVVMFNGEQGSDRICEWFALQMELANRSDRIVQIVGRRGIPPPKAFWIPPVCVESCLKLIFSQMRVPVIVSYSDHMREVISSLQSEPPKLPATSPQPTTGLDPSVLTAASFLPCSYDGLFVESSVYFALNKLPRLFSAHSLKLSIKQTLEAKEVSLEAILKHFELPTTHLLVYLSLLGGSILKDDDLVPYYQQKLNAKRNKDGKFEWPTLLKDLAAVVRDISESIIDKPSEVGAKIFSEMTGDSSATLSQKFADQLNFYKELASSSDSSSSNGSTVSRSGPKILTDSDAPSSTPPTIKRFAALGVSVSQLPNVIASMSDSFKPAISKVEENVLSVAKERHTRGHMHHWVYHLMTMGEIRLSTCIEPHACVQGVNPAVIVPVEDLPPSLVHLYRPVRQSAYSVLFDISQSTASHSTDSKDKEAPKDNGTTEKPKAESGAASSHSNRTVLIREWFIERANGVPTPAVDLVPSVPLQGFTNPSLSKLWLSRDSGDWMLRMKTFLNCFKADSPMMSSTMHLQAQHIVPCAVLRFLLSQSVGILLPHEFDAFLAQAVSPALQNPDYLADMELCSISARGIHLASMFMRGVDHAIFVNDVCGQPIQAEFCAPWLFFDGKLFQAKLSMASQGASPRDLCDQNHEQLYLFSNLRQAILDHLQPHFARYRLSPASGYVPIAPLSVPSSSEMIVMAGSRHSSRHDQHSHINPKGGHLEVGGVVVGSWGGYRPAHPNYPQYGPQTSYAPYAPASAHPYYQQPAPLYHGGGHPGYGHAGYAVVPPPLRYGDHPARRGGKGGGKRGGSATALTGMGRGRGAVSSGGKGGKKNKLPGAGRGGSVIEKSADNDNSATTAALEEAIETKLDINADADEPQQEDGETVNS